MNIPFPEISRRFIASFPNESRTSEKTRAGYGVSTEQLVISECGTDEEDADMEYGISEDEGRSEDERLSEDSSGESSNIMSPAGSPTVTAPGKFDFQRHDAEIPESHERSTHHMSIENLNTAFEANSSALRSFLVDGPNTKNREISSESRPRMPSIPSLVNKVAEDSNRPVNHNPIQNQNTCAHSDFPRYEMPRRQEESEDTEMEIKIIEKPSIFKTRPADGVEGHASQPICVDEEDEELEDVDANGEDLNSNKASMDFQEDNGEESDNISEEASEKSGSPAPSDISDDQQVEDEQIVEQPQRPAPVNYQPPANPLPHQGSTTNPLYTPARPPAPTPSSSSMHDNPWPHVLPRGGSKFQCKFSITYSLYTLHQLTCKTHSTFQPPRVSYLCNKRPLLSFVKTKQKNRKLPKILRGWNRKKSSSRLASTIKLLSGITKCAGLTNIPTETKTPTIRYLHMVLVTLLPTTISLLGVRQETSGVHILHFENLSFRQRKRSGSSSLKKVRRERKYNKHSTWELGSTSPRTNNSRRLPKSTAGKYRSKT